MVSVALVGCAHIHTPGFVKRPQARPDVRVKYVWDHQSHGSHPERHRGARLYAEKQLYFQSNYIAGADGVEPWTDLPEAWPYAFELFLDALAGEDAPLVGAREAATRSAVMEALYRGARTKRWVVPA